jgi:hypothetical protein
MKEADRHSHAKLYRQKRAQSHPPHSKFQVYKGGMAENTAEKKTI